MPMLLPTKRPTATAWSSDAACKGGDTDLFYPKKNAAGKMQDTSKAQAICATCPVESECLEYALDNNEQYGIWGGTTRIQRQHLRRERHIGQVVQQCSA